MDLTLKEIHDVLEIKFSGRDRKVTGVSIDTRTLKKGDVFFAIKGDETDGHKFIKAAIKKGASLVVAQEKIKGEKKVIGAGNTRNAFLNVASYYYKKFRKNGLKVVAITGSNGKTTTKEITATLLGNKYRVLKNKRSYNNYAGLPLTLFELKRSHQILVVELGMNRKGEIKRLVKAVDIDFAVITNIGRAHLGFFKNVAGIADAKSEIVHGMEKGGCIAINSDDKFFKRLLKAAGEFDSIGFGSNKDSDIRVSNIRNVNKKTSFTLDVFGKKTKMTTKMKGKHNVANIAAAISVAMYFGVSVKEIKQSIAGFVMTGMMRFEEKSVNGVNIINDSYNANPDSFRASIETVKNMKIKGLIVVTGDMLELGEKSASSHVEIGRILAVLKMKKLLIYGKEGKNVKKGFLSAKRGTGNSKLKTSSSELRVSSSNNKVQLFIDKKQLKIELKKVVSRGDTVFLKGSRGNKLEELI